MLMKDFKETGGLWSVEMWSTRDETRLFKKNWNVLIKKNKNLYIEMKKQNNTDKTS